MYTCDMPHLQSITVATYADNAAFMVSAECPIAAYTLLQRQLNIPQQWFQKWKIKINTTKSSPLTFSLRRET